MIRRKLQWTNTIARRVMRFEYRQQIFSEHRPCLGAHSSSPTSANGTPEMLGTTDRKVLERKLIYRSKQRGWLELDLIMGSWAEKNVPQLSLAELRKYEAILDEEIPDMFRWLTAQEDPPATVQQCPVFHRIKEYVSRRYEASLNESIRTKEGLEWVRGWDDVRSWTPK